jgi:hypothetical protein
LDVGDIEWVVSDWIGLAWGRDQWRALVNMAMDSIKCWEVLEWLHNWWPLQ